MASIAHHRLLTGPIVVGDDGSAGGADATAFANVLARDAGLDVLPTHAENGTGVPRALDDAAHAAGAGFVVVGAHRRENGGLPLGTTGDRLLHDARCPVAIVPAGWAAEFHPIRVVGVALDDRVESRHALAVGREIADRAGAAMRVIAVARPSAAAGDGVLAGLLHEAVRSIPRELRSLPVLLHGDPAERLADETGKGLDLLVCGSRGYGPVGAALLGSVSRMLLRHSECPVLIVPRRAWAPA
jgi:nucleotide-binding universal stress UspA family protein